MRLPVHCCCHPSLRLGWLETSHVATGGINIFVPNPLDYFEVGDWAPLGPQPSKIIRTEITQLNTLTATFLAIKSAHEPIEVWRRVPAFTEDQANVDQPNPRTT